LPDISWCEIPAGEFIYQGNERVKLPTYHIARYPITYVQFQAFLDAPDGFEDDRWWEGLTARYRKQAMAEQYFEYDNYPRDSVSWYQAVAYCRWLTAKYDEHGLWNTVGAQGLAPLHDNRRLLIRLPTEAEWEKAARGTEGLIYPYGNAFDPAKGNTSETGIGQTSAVGLFPDGASPYGVLDMSGNVWEWCLTAWADEYQHPGMNDPEGDARRVLRGGSWDVSQYVARAVSRYRNFPNLCGYLYGFRVVLGGVPS
jgi:formylglycine-generating enzyme required for sulfatase activity